MTMKRILVADDNAALARALSLRLTHEGFTVLHACDAYQALQLAQREKPDLLLLDFHMPAGTGFSVQQRIKNVRGLENLPVIYLTGDKSLDIEVEAAKLGALAVLHKPIKTEQLIRTIHSVLDSPPSVENAVS